ncbi:lysozyme family protein [Bradyrhizobium sp. USDA 377]
MPTLPQTQSELEALRASLFQQYQDAKSRNDQAEMARLTGIAGEIDDLLDKIAITDLQTLATKLEAIKAKIDTAAQKAKGWPFGSLNAPTNHERPFRDDIQDNDSEDQGPDAPAPQPGPMPSQKIPTVSPGWSQNYTELWSTIQIRPEWKKTSDAIASKIVSNQGRYAAAVSGTAIPWWFIAVVHAMECSLRFDQHLHNGDPLTARTVRVPKGRPPAGAPPFTWEESARDSIVYESLDKVTDWTLPSVLFHWHRYNGINNEYKRRGIPTPYLWSGSQHYTKGKYVADHEFDANAVSGQAGAAVILKALVDVGAVTVDPQFAVTTNAAAATEHVPSLNINTTGSAFQHVPAELDFPGALDLDSPRNRTNRIVITHVQEWLNIHGVVTPIDGDFGHSTAEQLKSFQIKTNREPTGQLDAETWALLTAPMRCALATIDHGPSSSFEDAILRVAQQHIKQMPIEIGGNNRGPWVRLYMRGNQGTDQKWCAGFVCFIVAQAARDLGTNIPFRRQAGVDELVNDAKASGRFVAESEVRDEVKRRSKLRPGQIFVVRASSTDWTHTGVVLSINDKTFDTFEGNTGGDGGNDGANARQGNRSYTGKDFIRLT